MALEEKRKYPRAPIEMWVKEEVGDYYFLHRACNISVGGLFLEKKVLVKKKQTATYLFRLPTSKELIVVQGQAVYDNISRKKNFQKGTGIKFIDLPVDAKKLINDYVIAFQ